MPAKRTAMRKIRDILRLRLSAGLSIRAISASTKVSVGAIQKLLSQAQALELDWPLPADLDDGQLARLFYPNRCYSYSQFCERYSQWLKRQKRSMRQSHRAGEKCFVDYAGQTVSLICADTGEIRQAQIFVAVLGASNYTYAEATWSQSLPDWLGSHVRAFAYFGGTPEMLVPDNLKSGVSRACRYDPDLNPSYQQLAAHYQLAVVPARPYPPVSG